MPQAIKSLKLFSSTDEDLANLHHKKEKFKTQFFYGHQFHRGSKNLAKLVPKESDASEALPKLLSSPGL